MDRQRKRLKYQRGPVNEKTTNDDVGGVNVEMDRISNLPPEILCHILSFLPTKYAVATCVLSTQWKNLFPQIPKLRLYLDDSLHCLRKSPSDISPVKFRRFVNKLFSVNLPQVRSIHSLCLYCQEYDGGSHIANWVRVALGRGVKNIEIKIYHIDNSNFLLHYLFGCKITSLSLSIDFDDEELEGKISLPNLKKLSVEGMNFMHVKAIVDGCPVVEHLLIDRCFTYARREFFIHIPSLKVLKFPDTDYLEPQVELDCPELEILNFSGSSGCRYFREELRSLRIAHLDTISRYPCLVYNRTVELLGVCSFVEKIYLSEMFIMALHNSARPLPYFHYLISLTIESMNSAAHDILPVMLECTPNLQDLIIEKGFDMESFEKLKTSLWRSWNFFICPQNDKRCLIVKIERYVDERYSSVTDKRYFFLTYNC